MKINVIGGEMNRCEIDEYLKYAAQKYVGRQIGQIDIVIDGEFVDLSNRIGIEHAYTTDDEFIIY